VTTSPWGMPGAGAPGRTWATQPSLFGARDFADDFTSNTLAATRWNKWQGVPQSYKKIGLWTPANVITPGDSTVTLRAQYQANVGTYTFGGMGSVPRWLYGLWLVAMHRSDNGGGPPASMSTNFLGYPAVGWPPEADWAEDGANTVAGMYSSLHYGVENSPTFDQMHCNVPGNLSAWHVWGCEWTPTQMLLTMRDTLTTEMLPWTSFGGANYLTQAPQGAFPLLSPNATIQSAEEEQRQILPHVPLNMIVQQLFTGSSVVPTGSHVDTIIDWAVHFPYTGG
jgi:hypothetical protein